MIMKITAGLGSIDDYPAYVKAGANELFMGYVPLAWQTTWGLTTPLNRREVCYYNVQAGSLSELEILSDMVCLYKVPVTLTFNGLSYQPDHYPVIARIIGQAAELGFTSVIIADLALLLYLYQHGISQKLQIHLSGEAGQINDYLLEEAVRLGISRLIFHRKVSLQSMKQIIARQKKPLEYEAFLLNENCHFHGAFCNSLHSDDLPPMCRMPYELYPALKSSVCQSALDRLAADTLSHNSCQDTGLADPALPDPGLSDDDHGPANARPPHNSSFYDYGLSNLSEMQEIGITHLKIVGRGACTDDMITSIALVREKLRAL